jgi:hypothetical protein
MPPAQLRFLPWTRSGLAAVLPNPDAGSPAPAHPTVKVGITVTSAGAGGVDLELYGPGDVVGVDPRLIVRTEPRPFTTNYEPNYLPAIEFDRPDFPWLFTPAAPGGTDHLRPWLVLIVVEQQPGVGLGVQAGAPLPVLHIAAPADPARELPDLSESWAWAHTQIVTADSSPGALATDLAAAPDLNVSRIVCPRRLEPGKQYYACLVPAFDVGAQRGLGGEPSAANADHAWGHPAAGDVRLPVFFHWEFATGPEGDFESLARKLQPFRSPLDVGSVPMYVGQAGPGLPELAAATKSAVLPMDGALRAPAAANLELAEVPQSLQDGLEQALDAPAQHLEGSAPAGAEPVGPPIYGQWPAKTHTVPDTRPVWLRQLNLDPRTRVAAGLGGEVVKANQEDFMQAAWAQVGEVLAANERLSAARLSFEALFKVHAKHIASLPGDRLLALTAPLHARTPDLGATVVRSIALTSMPDAAVDAAMRRVASPQRPRFKLAARLAGTSVAATGSARSTLLATLARGTEAVEPTRFAPDGIVRFAELGDAAPTGQNVDLSAFGLPAEVPAESIRPLVEGGGKLTSVLAAGPPTLSVRPNLGASGLVTETHLDELGSVLTPGAGISAVLAGVVETAIKNPGLSGFLVAHGEAGGVILQPVDVAANGEVSIRGLGGAPLAEIDPQLHLGAGLDVGGLIGGLPPGSLHPGDTHRGISPGLVAGTVTTTTAAGAVVTSGPLTSGPLVNVTPVHVSAGGAAPVGATVPVTELGPGSVLVEPGVLLGPVTGAGAQPTTNTLPPLVTETGTINRFTAAFATFGVAAELAAAPPALTLVPLDLGRVGNVLLARTDPAVMVPKRLLGTLVTSHGPLLTSAIAGLLVQPTFDRILAAPDLPAPAYRFLAAYDRKRFLPGVDLIPPDSVTLLETNPRFVEAFMVGLNHELNRELLWRAYPTDQRGTPFRHFWDRVDHAPDIDPIHQWNPAGGVATHMLGDPQGQLVLIVRGELLRRYPNTVVYAVRSTAADKLSEQAADVKTPVLAGALDPDINFVGFDLRDTDLDQGNGWFFVLQQQPTEPRFGFDETAAEQPAFPPSWSDASWADTGTQPGAHLAIVGNPLAGVIRESVTFLRDAAALAAISLQKPMRVAVHGRHLVKRDNA